MPPVGQKASPGSGPESALSAVAPARSLGREEFQEIVAPFGKPHRLGRGGRAGQHRQPGGLGRVEQRVGRARGHAELRPGGQGTVDVRWGQQRARTRDRARNIGHRGQRVGGGLGAKRHLDHGKPAFDQRLGERPGPGGIGDHQHRDHRHRGDEAAKRAGGGGRGDHRRCPRGVRRPWAAPRRGRRRGHRAPGRRPASGGDIWAKTKDICGDPDRAPWGPVRGLSPWAVIGVPACTARPVSTIMASIRLSIAFRSPCLRRRLPGRPGCGSGRRVRGQGRLRSR
jgi:hypothetical protein